MAAASHSLKTISKLLDLSPRRVQQLVKEGVIPKMERGRYELVPVVRAYIHYLRERNIQAGVVSLEEVRTRKIKAEAELAEIDLAQQRGETINVDAAAIVWGEVLGVAKSRLLSIPAKLAPIVAVEDAPAICKALIEEQVFEVLDELADDIAVWAEDAGSGLDEDGSDGIEAAAEIDDERVGGQPPETVA
jgi:hypothetical protein